MATRDGGISADDLVLPLRHLHLHRHQSPNQHRYPRPNLQPYRRFRPYLGWSDPAAVGEPWGSTVEGLLTFRGNPTRTYYGKGPIPESPIKSGHILKIRICAVRQH